MALININKLKEEAAKTAAKAKEAAGQAALAGRCSIPMALPLVQELLLRIR